MAPASRIAGACLAWYTALNVLPVFVVRPVVGRILTCAFLGQGPAIFYDLVLQVKEWVGKVGK